MNANLLHILNEYKVNIIQIINDTSSKLNMCVKQIYVINLKEDICKRNYIYVLFKKYKINYNLIIVDIVKPNTYRKICGDNKISVSELGCCLSHMWCLTHILKNKFENAIIFEDDIILSKKFIESFISIYEKNPKLDFLMLGAHDLNFSKQHFKNVKNNLYRPNNNTKIYGAHANFYSLNGVKRIFYIRATNLSFFDNEYNLLFDTLPNSYICYPNLALSNVSESRINHEKKILSTNETGYYSACFTKLNLNNYNFIYINLLDLSYLEPDDTTDTFVDRCLSKLFNDFEKIQLIKKRFTLDFFTIDDIKDILSVHTLITPNNLSKKCIGEHV